MDSHRLGEVGTLCDLAYVKEHEVVDKRHFINNLHLWAPNNPYRSSNRHGLFRIHPIPATHLIDQSFPKPIHSEMKHVPNWQAFFEEWLPSEGMRYPQEWVDLAFELFVEAIDWFQFPIFYDHFTIQSQDFYLSRAPKCIAPIEPILFSENQSFIANVIEFLQFLFQGIDGLEYSQDWADHYNLDRSMLKGYFDDLRFMAINIWQQLKTTEYARWEYILPLDYLEDEKKPSIEIWMTHEGLAGYFELIRMIQPLHDALSELFERSGLIWLNDYDEVTLQDTDGKMVFDKRARTFLSWYDIHDRDDIWFSMFLAKCFPQTHSSPYCWRQP